MRDYFSLGNLRLRTQSCEGTINSAYVALFKLTLTILLSNTKHLNAEDQYDYSMVLNMTMYIVRIFIFLYLNIMDFNI